MGNSVREKNPQLAKEWDYEKNGINTPDNVTYGSDKKVWWKCENGHEFYSTIYSRYKSKHLCKYCYKEQKEKNRNSLKKKL